ncbi:desiccation-related protein PCC13-62-like [Hibiscus syriacus]|uniref:desiccation-related protein PCC13-62-like n=1 Tax=Hibiscus syriacus TaxID=106335 RepID=UPI0019232B39|nr:desiccation-related protein PCC13-62-like [Hibiscus syriacus]
MIAADFTLQCYDSCMHAAGAGGEHVKESQLGCRDCLATYKPRINDIAPDLINGPAPIGVTSANVDIRTRRFIDESGLASLGHIRAIANITSLQTPLTMPQLDIRAQVFAKFIDVLNVTLDPPFNIYPNTDSFLSAAAYTSYLLKQYYAGIMPSILGNLGNVTTLLTAQIINQLGGCGVKDEGLTVPLPLGAETRTTNNVIPADVNTLSYKRTALEILRIVFITGNATRAGGFFPNGFVGTLYQRIVALNQSQEL